MTPSFRVHAAAAAAAAAVAVAVAVAAAAAAAAAAAVVLLHRMTMKHRKAAAKSKLGSLLSQLIHQESNIQGHAGVSIRHKHTYKQTH